MNVIFFAFPCFQTLPVCLVLLSNFDSIPFCYFSCRIHYNTQNKILSKHQYSCLDKNRRKIPCKYQYNIRDRNCHSWIYTFPSKHMRIRFHNSIHCQILLQ